MHLQVQGRLNMDRFYGDMVLEPMAVMAVPKPMKMDNAPEKRVELHLHTTMSAMDALTSVGPKLGPDKNVVKRAEAWGHRAIAITDHGWPSPSRMPGTPPKRSRSSTAWRPTTSTTWTTGWWSTGRQNSPFDQEIVCFDIETTGPEQEVRGHHRDRRRGAEKRGDHRPVQHLCVPGRILSPEIIRLTGITDEMLVGAPSQEEALRAFLAFAGDRPWRPTTPSSTWALSPPGCRKYGIPFHNPSIDSLILAQNLLPDLGKYKLDIVAEHLHLPAFNHHRASDDAATVGYMLPPLL